MFGFQDGRQPAGRHRIDAEGRARGVTGRRFVVGLIAMVLLVGAGLSRTFRDWRRRSQERVAFGRREVPPTVRPLQDTRPDGIDPQHWVVVVQDTEALLNRVVGADLLDRPGLVALRDELNARVAEASAETAAGVLAGIWWDMDRRAGPPARRVPWPDLLEPAALVAPLADLTPPGVSKRAWRREVAALQTRLVLARASGQDSPPASELIDHTRQAMRDPTQAAEQLREITARLDARNR
jgi:hypothetical protein